MRESPLSQEVAEMGIRTEYKIFCGENLEIFNLVNFISKIFQSHFNQKILSFELILYK